MFLKGMKCTNSDCLYLHYLGDKEDSFTKEQMLQSSKQAFLDQTQLDNDIGELFFRCGYLYMSILRYFPIRFLLFFYKQIQKCH
jgi:hypothetical protein